MTHEDDLRRIEALKERLKEDTEEIHTFCLDSYDLGLVSKDVIEAGRLLREAYSRLQHASEILRQQYPR